MRPMGPTSPMDVYTLALILAALVAIPVLGNAIHILIAIVRYGF